MDHANGSEEFVKAGIPVYLSEKDRYIYVQHFADAFRKGGLGVEEFEGHGTYVEEEDYIHPQILRRSAICRRAIPLRLAESPFRRMLPGTHAWQHDFPDPRGTGRDVSSDRGCMQYLYLFIPGIFYKH